MAQFNSVDAADFARRSHGPKSTRRKSSRPYTISQAFDIQYALHDAALLLKNDLATCSDVKVRAQAAAAMASCAKGFQAMGEQIRVLKGKPLPGSLRPESKPKTKRTQAPDFKESLSPSDPYPLPQPADPDQKG